MISIWLCPTHEDELYLQKIINKLSENYNSPIFLPHCTLLGGIKLNEFDLENIIDISIDNIGLIKIKLVKIPIKTPLVLFLFQMNLFLYMVQKVNLQQFT